LRQLGFLVFLGKKGGRLESSVLSPAEVGPGEGSLPEIFFQLFVEKKMQFGALKQYK